MNVDSTPGPARVGIGGPVGSGKTALIEALIPRLSDRGYGLAVVTNDLVTQEDAMRLKGSGLLDPERIIGVEAGACPHTAIREDPTLNIEASERLERTFEGLDLIIIESDSMTQSLPSTSTPPAAIRRRFISATTTAPRPWFVSSTWPRLMESCST